GEIVACASARIRKGHRLRRPGRDAQRPERVRCPGFPPRDHTTRMTAPKHAARCSREAPSEVSAQSNEEASTTPATMAKGPIGYSSDRALRFRVAGARFELA